MSRHFNTARALVGGALVAACVAISTADAQAPGPSPAKIAVENRKAEFTLIGNFFRWFGAVARGNAPYDEAEAKKRAARIAYLAEFLDESFPEISNVGEPDSKAKPEVWKEKADFDKKLAKFKDDARIFAETVAKEKGATEAFKTAVANLGQDCKGCHDSYKAK
ncbi:cytochrome c [Methylosinus sporium]|uniref:Cytochrome c n=1 Tax=Methylosinus sporium TaxID=428 RepID=A0A549SXW6_METSR|nr:MULTISPECIES: cytochrome c [Methylosinus]MBU3889355.1 cytochrome c [Methylosinus sp. KRF6]TRL34437.1 cytochrome c [Methylosinus sporium]